eukprot:g16594.t1
MPINLEELETAIQEALAAKDSHQSTVCLSEVIETLQSPSDLAESFWPGHSPKHGPARDYSRVTEAFDQLVKKGSCRWSSELADLVRGAAAWAMPALPRRPFAHSDFSDRSETVNAPFEVQECDLDLLDVSGQSKQFNFAVQIGLGLDLS